MSTQLGASRVALYSLCQACHGLRPRGSEPSQTISASPMLTSANLTASSFPFPINIGALSLQPCGLRPTCLLSYA